MCVRRGGGDSGACGKLALCERWNGKSRMNMNKRGKVSAWKLGIGANEIGRGSKCIITGSV